MVIEELAITIGNQGVGEWELRLEGGGTVEAYLTEVDVSEEHGLRAEGRNEDEGSLFQLTTGKQPGGPIRLRRRSLADDEWEEVGEVVDAVKRD